MQKKPEKQISSWNILVKQTNQNKTKKKGFKFHIYNLRIKIHYLVNLFPIAALTSYHKLVA